MRKLLWCQDGPAGETGHGIHCTSMQHLVLNLTEVRLSSVQTESEQLGDDVLRTYAPMAVRHVKSHALNPFCPCTGGPG